MKTVRYIMYYSTTTDKLIGKFKLPDDISLSDLQSLFEMPPYNPMYDAYLITEKQVAQIERWLKRKINLSQYEYYLQTYGVE